MSDNRVKGLAFGIVPVWVDGECIEARWWWCDLLFEIVEPIWRLSCTIGGVEPEAYPVRVKQGEVRE